MTDAQLSKYQHELREAQKTIRRIMRELRANDRAITVRKRLDRAEDLIIFASEDLDDLYSE